MNHQNYGNDKMRSLNLSNFNEMSFDSVLLDSWNYGAVDMNCGENEIAKMIFLMKSIV